MTHHYPHPIIAREGWMFLAGALVVAVLASYFIGGSIAILAWLVFLLVLQFFRDPAREIPQDPNAVLSPADGRIIAVEKVNDPYVQRDAIKVSVFMNLFNVRSNRSPVDGTVQQTSWYSPNKLFHPDLDKVLTDSERNAIWLKTANGSDVTSVQVAGFIARRILCYVSKGDVLSRGQRYGFIRFGSRVDVYLPLDAQINVSIGDKVSATTTILARLA